MFLNKDERKQYSIEHNNKKYFLNFYHIIIYFYSDQRGFVRKIRQNCNFDWSQKFYTLFIPKVLKRISIKQVTTQFSRSIIVVRKKR